MALLYCNVTANIANGPAQIVTIDTTTGQTVNQSITVPPWPAFGYAQGSGGTVRFSFGNATNETTWFELTPDLQTLTSHTTARDVYSVQPWQGRTIGVTGTGLRIEQLNEDGTTQPVVTPGSGDPNGESIPEQSVVYQNTIYWTQQGPSVTAVNLLTGITTFPIALLEISLYSESEAGATLDVDLQGVAVSPSRGYVYAFGYNETTSVDPSNLMFFRAPLGTTGQWERFYETTDAAYTNSFSGTSVLIEPYLYTTTSGGWAAVISRLNLDTLEFVPNIITGSYAWSGNVVSLLNFPFGVPPTRQYPRDDNLALGSPRVQLGAASSSIQASYRVGTRGTYS